MNVHFRFTRSLVVLLTVTSLLGVQIRLPAAGLVSSAKVVDVVLSPDGTLTGRVVDTRNRPRGGTIVDVKRGRRVVARARTDADGRYAITDLPGGLYQFRVDDSERLVRAWAAGTAPRGADRQLRVVADAPVVRGQDEEPPTEAPESTSGDLFSSPITSALLVFGGIAGVILLIAELDDSDPPPASP